MQGVEFLHYRVGLFNALLLVCIDVSLHGQWVEEFADLQAVLWVAHLLRLADGLNLISATTLGIFQFYSLIKFVAEVRGSQRGLLVGSDAL